MRHKGKTWNIFSYYEDRWVTIRQTTKTAARNAYERGECFYMMPCLLSPDSRFDVEDYMLEAKNIKGDKFERVVSYFVYYHCKNPDLGKYPIFFIEERENI